MQRHNIYGVFFLLTLLVISDQSLAQTGVFDSGTNFLNALMDVLTNTWARIIGIIAICGVGIAWMTGRLKMMVFASVVGGIVLIFGSAAIVDGIAANI